MKILKKLSAFLCSITLLLTVFASAAAPAKAASAQSITMRVEGQKSTLYSGSASFTQGEDFYDIMSAALAEKGVNLEANNGTYGHEVVSIGGESGTYPVWWHLYVNGKSSDVGVDSLKPANGDEVVFYLGDDSEVLFPTVTFTPKYPVEGQSANINVSATYTDYSDYTNPAVKTQKISGVTITFNGKAYTTDSDGNADVTMPSAGSYTMTAVKEKKDATVAIVRTGDIPVTVYTKDTVPTDSSPNGGDGGKPAQTAVTSSAVSNAIKTGADYIFRNGITDWGSSVAYSSADGSVPQSYFDSVKADIASGGTALPTHLAGVIIGLRAAGANPQSFDGSDLVAQLYNSKDIGKTGLNGYTYGLLALDCGNYKLPSTAPISREKIIDAMLSYQEPNGAFSLDKNTAPDTDMTAIAVTALAPYVNERKVKTAVDSAINYLSKVQQPDGGFIPAYSTSEGSETTAQVVIALASVGIDPLNDTRFIKNGSSPISNLMAYKKADGAFSHTSSGSSDLIATEQAVTALAAYERFQNSGARIYDLTSVSGKIENPKTGSEDMGFTAVITSAAALSAFLLLKRRRKVD
jgi:LPXTG-motif cell wall-anchored protein